MRQHKRAELSKPRTLGETASAMESTSVTDSAVHLSDPPFEEVRSRRKKRSLQKKTTSTPDFINVVFSFFNIFSYQVHLFIFIYFYNLMYL